MTTVCCLATLFAGPVAAAPDGGPPREVLERAQAALDVLDGHGFAGSYLLSVKVDVDAPGDDDDEDSLEVTEVTIGADGSKTERLVRALDHGRDVTSEKIREHGVEESSDTERHEVEVNMLPLGSKRSLYAFTPARSRDGVMVSGFRPAAHRPASAHDDEDDFLAAGEFAWDPASGDPLWIELDPAEAKHFVSKLHMRFEFDREGRTCYLRRIETVTRAGIPLIVRVKADVTVEISDVSPLEIPAAGEPTLR